MLAMSTRVDRYLGDKVPPLLDLPVHETDEVDYRRNCEPESSYIIVLPSRRYGHSVRYNQICPCVTSVALVLQLHLYIQAGTAQSV
jgi:hypothetical protein